MQAGQTGMIYILALEGGAGFEALVPGFSARRVRRRFSSHWQSGWRSFVVVGGIVSSDCYEVRAVR